MAPFRSNLTIHLFAVSALILGLGAGAALAQEPSASRWIVRLGEAAPDAQIQGLLRAAAARGCTEANRTSQWITFDCPQGQPPTPQATELHRYFLHDATTNALIRADDVHDGIGVGPFDGTGVKVAVLDGGIDTDHPALQGILAGCLDPRGTDPNDCEDEDGHGTAVSGIIAGTTPDSVAPGASIIAVKLFNGTPVFADDVAIALLALLALPAADQPDVINMSFGGGKSTGDNCDNAGDPSVELINGALDQAGIVSVVSSGNSKYKDGVSFPSCASGAISVGAVYQSSHGRVSWLSGCTDRNTFPDLVTCFSNAGPGLDVVAPGAFITTAALGGGFAWFHGTSASAPVVAGAAALLKQQNPTLTAAEVLDILNSTSPEICNAGSIPSSRRITPMPTSRAARQTPTATTATSATAMRHATPAPEAAWRGHRLPPASMTGTSATACRAAIRVRGRVWMDRLSTATTDSRARSTAVTPGRAARATTLSARSASRSAVGAATATGAAAAGRGAT
jgi:subtilisin family serine protease